VKIQLIPKLAKIYTKGFKKMADNIICKEKHRQNSKSYGEEF
jgi:hypothetical protein